MKKSVFSIFCAIGLFLCGCSDTYLDEKPRSKLVVPNTLKDFRQLLDNGNVMLASSELPEVMSDDYYLESTYWNSRRDVVTRNAHVWATDIYEGGTSFNGWNKLYEQVFYCNVVLDGLESMDVPSSDQTERDNLKGSALFLRAFAFYELSQLFAPVFDDATADADLGVPLPLISDVNQPISRSTVKETYDQIFSDLDEAERYLWNPADYSRPSRPALFGLLARVCLSVGDYTRAGKSADASLKLYDNLTDLNDANRDYKQTTYLRYMNPPGLLHGVNANIWTADELYESYDEFDLRKSTYYRIGSTGQPYRDARYYNLGANHFTGIDTDELFLIRAECAARAGDAAGAMTDLNHLLEHRYLTGTYLGKTSENADDALDLILQERRKELVFRNLRWTDLRRFNRDGANITLTRHLEGKVYSLPASSNRWVFPIPPNEINGSNIKQNLRD